MAVTSFGPVATSAPESNLGATFGHMRCAWNMNDVLLSLHVVL